MPVFDFHITKMGASSLLVQWQEERSDTFLRYLIALTNTLKQTFEVEALHTYQEVLLKNFPTHVDMDDVFVRLREILNKPKTPAVIETNIYKIPVCYDVAFGMDIQTISGTNNLSISEIIQMHTSPLYRVYFMGFLPGFPYLEGLHKKLSIDRKVTPAASVMAGSVAIGGNQTGVYPQSSPGGWHIIGHSPVRFFDVESPNTLLLKAGDQIQFYPVSKSEHTQLSGVAQEEYLEVIPSQL